VLAGDPFGIEQGQGPGLDGNGHLNVKQASRRIGRIEVQAYRIFLRAGEEGRGKKDDEKASHRSLNRTSHVMVEAGVIETAEADD